MLSSRCDINSRNSSGSASAHSAGNATVHWPAASSARSRTCSSAALTRRSHDHVMTLAVTPQVKMGSLLQLPCARLQRGAQAVRGLVASCESHCTPLCTVHVTFEAEKQPTAILSGLTVISSQVTGALYVCIWCSSLPLIPSRIYFLLAVKGCGIPASCRRAGR